MVENADVGNGLVSAKKARQEMRSNTVCVTYCPLSWTPARVTFARAPRADRELLAATDAIRNEFSARTRPRSLEIIELMDSGGGSRDALPCIWRATL